MPWNYLVSDEPPPLAANRHMVSTRPGHQITALGHWCDRVAAPLPNSPYPRLPAAPHRPFHTTASFHPDNHPARYVPTEHNGWGKRANPIYFNGMEDYVPESLHLQNPKGWAVDAEGKELFEAIPSARKEGEWEKGRKLTNMDLWACPGMKFFGTPYVTRRLGPSPMLAKAKQGNVVVIMKFGPELPPEMLLDIREKLKEALRRKKWPREQDRVEVERLVDDPKTPEAVLAPLLALAEDNEVDVLERKDESIENAQQKDEPVAINSFNRLLRTEAETQGTPSSVLDTPARKDPYFEAKEQSRGNRTAHDHSGYDTSSYLDPHDDTFAHKYTPGRKTLKSSLEFVTSPSVLPTPKSNKSLRIDTPGVASAENSRHDTTGGDNATSIDDSVSEVSLPPSPSILMPPPPSINPLEAHKKFMAGWVECKPIRPTKIAPLSIFFEDDHLEDTFLRRRPDAAPTHSVFRSPEGKSPTDYKHAYEPKKAAHCGGLFGAFKKHVEPAPYVDHSLFAKWKKFNRDPSAVVPGADVTTNAAAWEHGVVHDVEEEESMGEPLTGSTPAPEKEFGKPVMESTPGPSNAPKSRAEFTPWLRGIEGVGSARPERKTPCRQNSGNVKVQQADTPMNWRQGQISESPEFTDEPSSMLESFSTPVFNGPFKTPRPLLVKSLTAPPLGAEFRTPLKSHDDDSTGFNFSSWIRDEREVDYAPRIDLNRKISPVPATGYFKLGKTRSPAKPSSEVLTRICTPFRHASPTRETSKSVYPSPHSVRGQNSAMPAYNTFPVTAATRNPHPANVEKPFIIFPALAAFKVPLKAQRTYLLTEIPALNRQAAHQHALAEAARMLRIKDWLNFIGTRRPLFWYSALWLDPPGHPRYPERVMMSIMEPPALAKKGKKLLKRKATASSIAKGKKLITPDTHARGKFKLEVETLNEKKGKGKRKSTSTEISPPKKTITPTVRAKGKFSPPITPLDLQPDAKGKRKSIANTPSNSSNLTPLAQHSQTKLNSSKPTTRKTRTPRLSTGSENAVTTTAKKPRRVTTAKKPRRVTTATRARSPPPRYRTVPRVSAYMRHIRSFPNPPPLSAILKATLPTWFDGSDLQYHLRLEARVTAQPVDIQAEVEADGRAIGLLSRRQGANGEPSAWANAMEERWNEADFGREEMVRVREERVERERVAGERRGRVRAQGVLEQRFRQGRDFAVFMDPEV